MKVVYLGDGRIELTPECEAESDLITRWYDDYGDERVMSAINLCSLPKMINTLTYRGRDRRHLTRRGRPE